MYGCAGLRPLIAVADASIVTSYFVAFGRRASLAGVKIRIVVPDQRKVPGTAGAILKNGAVTGCGIRPSTTIGSENVTRISFASVSASNSPVGPALTTVNGFEAVAGC